MSAGTEQRKLAAIMFTDMVGYSALSQRNEALALELLEDQRRLLCPIFPRHQGREVKSTGDGFLVEFPSALAAALCAIEVQRTMVQHNAACPPERRFQIRIGLHVGDVVHREGDIFGDGVNIAARIEPLAQAGGICLSRPVVDQIANKIDASLVKLGPTELKNIQVPMELFRIVLPWEKSEPARLQPRSVREGAQRVKLIATGLLAICLGSALVWWLLHGQRPAQIGMTATNGLVAHSGATVGRVESLMVKPLDNLSRDTNQNYFVDGMTEELRIRLSKIRALKKVISRTSAMQYRQTAKSVPQIAQELKVDAVVEGSVLESGNQVRISVQLIEGATDRSLWGESYVYDLTNVIRLQNEVARAIAREIKAVLTPEEQGELARDQPVNPDAFRAYLQGRNYWFQFTPEGFQKAREANLEAIRLDPGFGPAHAALARCYVSLSNTELLPPKAALQKAKESVARALQLDASGEALEAQATIQVFLDWDWPGAKVNLARADALIPKYFAMHALHSWYFILLGRFPEAMERARTAAELEPLTPMAIVCVPRVLLYQRHYEEAISEYRKVFDLFPRVVHVVYGLGRAYERSGQPAKAVSVFAKALEGGRSPMLLEGLATALAADGERDEAQKIATELGSKYRQAVQTQQGYVSPWHLAVVSMALGEKQQALDWLERGFDEGAFGMLLLNVEPAFDSIRSEERFQTLLKKMRFPL